MVTFMSQYAPFASDWEDVFQPEILTGDEELRNASSLANHVDRHGQSVLEHAARMGATSIAKLLLDAGAQVERGGNQLNALHIAAARGFSPIVSAIATNGS